MGTLYSVGCYDCHIHRNLDKFYRLEYEVETREEAISFSDDIKNDSFRAGLLVSFMGKHKGHKCVVYSEHDEEIWEHFEPEFRRANDDYDFWKPEEE